jgi:hypothetical protein
MGREGVELFADEPMQRALLDALLLGAGRAR